MSVYEEQISVNEDGNPVSMLIQSPIVFEWEPLPTVEEQPETDVSDSKVSKPKAAKSSAPVAD